ncbi:nucleoside-diphosphate sugar epimerase/dehydratase [Elizabethkingia anophelis]|uniref:nucleoside-diphosphate sugar epimerase/dehydratase n=1 Tax=Elizabethkingia anophelis TaxID=1117645 RepID=UPI0037870894
MKRVAIIGSGHLGQQIAHHIHTDTEDVVVGYFDEYQKIGQKVNNIIVLGGIMMWKMHMRIIFLMKY